jgi:CheY-like chemotaxis protein
MEAMGQLASGIAHDFNNILMVIQSYTEMLQGSLPADDPFRGNTGVVIRAAQRGASLTGQLLAFSRKHIISPVVLDLNAVTNETTKMLRRIIGEDIELQVHSESLWAVKADPDQIVQILMNLCVNSRDAMPQGGTLTIATGNVTVEDQGIDGQPHISPGDYVKLSVTDTGTGICREVQEQLFEPFFTTKEVGKGTGLGLAIVYGIVKQSGGFVWVDSEPGKGACFTIYLPRVKGALVPEMSLKGEKQTRGTETLLLVDDEEALREALCLYLRSLGYTVLVASSGQQALLVAKQQGRIDLLITDVVMPKMSGRELSLTLGSRRLDLKTIYMSGYTDDAILRHGIHEMGTCFLQKPFGLGTLARKVRDTLYRTEPLH